MYDQLIFDKVPKVIQWEMDSIFNKWPQNNWIFVWMWWLILCVNLPKPQYPGIWSNIIPDVLWRYFKMTLTSQQSLGKADYPPNCRWVLSSQRPQYKQVWPPWARRNSACPCLWAWTAAPSCLQPAGPPCRCWTCWLHNRVNSLQPISLSYTPYCFCFSGEPWWIQSYTIQYAALCHRF